MTHYTFSFERSTSVLSVSPQISENISRDEAIKVSLQKWRFLHNLVKKNPHIKMIHGINSKTCALCTYSNRQGDYDIQCDKCPLLELTGKPQCAGTSYYDFLDTCSEKAAETMIDDLLRCQKGVAMFTLKDVHM